VGRRYDPVVQQAREEAAALRLAMARARAAEVERKRSERNALLGHRQSQVAAADDQTQQVVAHVDAINQLLHSAADATWVLDFASLRRSPEIPPLDAKGADIPGLIPQLASVLPPKLSFLGGLVPGAKKRHATATEAAHAMHAARMAEYAQAEDARRQRLGALRAEHEALAEKLRAAAAAFDAEIAAFEAAYLAGDTEAVVRYYSVVLGRDDLPEGFPEVSRVAYTAESRQVVVERDVPAVEVVPSVTGFRYVKVRDVIESSPRPPSQIRTLYASLVAQVALRTLHTLFAADRVARIDSAVVNLVVDTIDPSTGRRIRPCLLTVRAAKDAFMQIDLTKVEPLACLRGLGAQVSPSPHELRAVRPLVDFNMVDPRFISTPDVLSHLDDRPNLALLSPGEFEALITNLFSKMGLETKLTQASRDGGVDCVAWDMRPVVGGKVIVQAKRYKNTVGVSAVRDLYGTVMNEGAAKGILVTTSGYGRSAYDFVANKPLELITGSNLLYLLEEHTAVTAKIEFPDEWTDPVPDSNSELASPPTPSGPISLDKVRRDRTASG
jgi:restriction system protein